MTRLRLAVIGVGHLGKEHARVLAGLPDVDLVGVVDTNPDQGQAIAKAHATRAFTSSDEIIDLVDGVVIATPTVHHHESARPFLDRAIPVLVEKPITSTIAEAEDLVARAEATGTPLQIGHIERFNPAFEALLHRKIQPKFIECERVGRFTGRSVDIGVVLDLMIHDLDMLLALVAAEVVAVEAIGAGVFGGHEDLVNARLTFANGCVANLTASRISPRSLRRMRVWAPEGYAKADFGRRRLTLVQPCEQVRRFGLDPRKLPAAARAAIKEDLFGKYLQVLEVDCQRIGDQLTRELQDFLQVIRHRSRPRVTGRDGLNALALAERILTVVRNHPWTGSRHGPCGPEHLPAPLGKLFDDFEEAAA